MGEKYYPDILASLRGLQVHNSALGVPSEDDTDDKPQRRSRAPTIVLDKIDSEPSYGEDPGPDGSLQRKEAFEKRKMDAEPDEVRVVETDGAGDLKPRGRKRAPTIVVDKIDAPPSYGEDPGPDGTLQRKEAFEKRKMDAAPDMVRVHSEDERY